jgi:hypothetical protein
LGEPVGTVAYHVRVLNEGDWVFLAYTRPARGALEHFYQASGKAQRELLVLDERAWQELVTQVDEFFVQVRKLQAGAARRASRRTRVGQDGPAPFAVSVMTLLHSAQPRTQSEPPAVE